MWTRHPAPRSARRPAAVVLGALAAIRRFGTAAAVLLAATAAAQPLAGTYQGASDVGPTTVVLEEHGNVLTGNLEAPGLRFALEGEVREGIGLGRVTTGQGTAGFEAHVLGDTLGLYLFELDAAGGAVAGSVIELILQRIVAAPAPRPGADEPAVGGPESPPLPAAATSPVLAQGAYGRLTEDAARAFLEALEFVFAEIGVPYVFPDAERRAAIEALAAAYPSASHEEQLVLADARAIWNRVRANWPDADLAARREFALGVLTLAYGEETVAQWVGAPGRADGAARGAAGGGSGCATFEDCAGAYVGDQTWSDTFNTQGCWAAAGCQGYDVSSGTFDYGDGY